MSCSTLSQQHDMYKKRSDDPSVSGIGPVNRLLNRYLLTEKIEVRDTESQHQHTYNTVSAVICPIVSGIGPVKLLLKRRLHATV
jgi:hypothetical protein